MFQIITAWNFVHLENDLEKAVSNITLRGYNSRTFLTGEFSRMIANNEIRSLSISDIADYLCPTRRDLYFKKGRNRKRIRRRKTWGGVAGRIVENFTFYLFNEFKSYKARSSRLYSKIIGDVNCMSKNFRNKNSESFYELNGLRRRDDEDPDWLLKLLTCNGRAELGLRLLHKMISKGGKSEMDVADLEITQDELKPNPWQIGISRGVKPDFIVKRYKVIGDIKSGIGGFKDYYLLTCAGYALACENEKGKDGDINFGIIYFFPTRYSEHAKPISFGQVYIFPIDDALREWFLERRNDAYKIVSKNSPPDFPEDKSHCSYCQFYDICESQGLRL
jgi:CRISPR/Cas system-associated exonuclease Cas4 (RecB family)